MHIKSFHIDAFGKLANVGMDDLPAGLSIFIGKNEAGKSTCLEFFRTMLTGLPAGKARKQFSPVGNKQALGGFMTLTSPLHGNVRLTRHLIGNKEQISITDAEGNPLTHISMPDLMCGISHEVFRNVFGFSLTELQLFATLNGDAVKDALYGASFGMGLRSPGEVIKRLTKTREDLFKPKGTTTPLNEALTQWKKLQEELSYLRTQCENYDALHMQEIDLMQQKNDLRDEKKQCEAHIYKAQQQLSAWKLWEEWHKIDNTLERLEYVTEAFPENGIIRLEQTQKDRQQAQLNVQKQQERCRNLEQDILACYVDEKLLQSRADLQALSERKSAFRHAQSAIAPLQSSLQRHAADLQAQLAQLGTDWTCDRIRETNRSLFARDSLEKIVTDIQTTEHIQVAATAALEKANATVAHMEGTLAQAHILLADVPQPVAALDDAGREYMRRNLAAIEHAQKSLEEKHTSERSAEQAFDRAMLHVHLYGEDKPIPARLEKLLQAQEHAMALASQVQSARNNTQQHENILAQASDAEDIARNRVERARQNRAHGDTVSRPHLDIRAKAVRNLRHLHNTFSIEKERHTELKERLENSVAPAPVKSVALLTIGLLIILCGVAGILLPMFANITEVRITEQLIIPLTQWSSYFVVLAGAAFLAGGMPRSGSETKMYEQSLGNMQSRLQSSTLRLTELEGQIQEQCVIAEIQDADPVTLDAVELKLETAREQCATGERVVMEIQILEEELDDAIRRTKQKREFVTQAQAEEQQSLRAWHDTLMGHHVQNIPSPDAASTFFARVEAALLSHQNVHNARVEMGLLEKKILECKNNLSNIAPVADYLAQSMALPETPQAIYMEDNEARADTQLKPSLEDVLNASHAILDKCRLADAAQAERLKAESAVNNAQQHLDMALHAQKEAAQAVQDNEHKFAIAHASWTESLKKLSIPMHISPSLLHATLDCMERCLSLEGEMGRIQEEIAAHERECQALIVPLQELMQHCSTSYTQDHEQESEAENDAQNTEAKETESAAEKAMRMHHDWAHILDTLLFEAQAAQEAARQLEQYKRELTIHEEDLHVASSALSDSVVREEALLRQGQAKNSEDFLRLAAIHMQRKELLQRKADLKDALSLAARDTDLDTFLQSFTTTDEYERRIFINTKEKDLEELVIREQECVNNLAGVTAELRTMATSDHIADLRQQERNLEESIKTMAADWCRSSIARHLILLAKERYEDERQPEVIRTASQIFASITAGRWEGIAASLEKNALNVIPPQGHPVEPDVLSRGTQEQLYLALRLAYIRHHAKSAMALPIIMDDVLVNFDPQRSQQTARALLQLSQGQHGSQAHQILFFTCHPHMADMLQDICPQSQRFLVEDGNIQRTSA